MYLQTFLSVWTDGEIWQWTGEELDDAEYKSTKVRKNTFPALAWNVSSAILFFCLSLHIPYNLVLVLL